ncbi:AraC family transcriptional regulator [uncultured Vibrio sp.]|uniref:AraC family transcriptional regulator n=1 Tax=uncultured Vibrio sp. TaxID=114054 RepID=UPI0029C9278A|nr:AraC family transcriptional regulator [uncultured Vibrio sp.]
MHILIRATNLRGYDSLTQSLGGDPRSLLSKYHIASADKRDEDSFLLFRNMIALLEDTATILDCPDFGLRLAEYQGMGILGPISVIARSSATVGDALENISRYLHLHCSALTTKHIAQTKGQARTIKLEYSVQGRGIDYSVQCYELGLANAMQVIKLLCGNDFKPISAHFMHSRLGDEASYQNVFGCPIEFNQNWCGFILPESAFDTPLSSEDEQTCKLARHYLDSQPVPFASSVSDDVRRLIKGLLPTGQCSTENIASHLSMHKRTLQRKLAQESTTYEQILVSERQVIVTKYLKDPNLKLSQISGLLGYSEQATFNRACRAWFDVTPRTYRALLLEEASSDK